MTKNDICRMCSEYSVDTVCEHKKDCELLKLIDENEELKAMVKKLEHEAFLRSWDDCPDRMGR